MTGPAGEMPFLDHLEELRIRILRALLALAIGFGVGLWLVDHFQLVLLLEQPILPFLHGSKLVVTSPTDPVYITFELGFFVGLVLASPVVIYQLWAFLSPALYAKEKRTLVPALVAGAFLFGVGVVLSYLFLVPQALRVLFSFQSEAIAPMITYEAYFSFVLQVVLAMGLSCELPLVIMILAGLGLVTPAGLGRFRRYAIVLACIAGAVLSPGTDVLSMLMMTIPFYLLYEVGVAGAAVIARRRRRAIASTAVGILLLLALPPPVRAQVPDSVTGQQPVAPANRPLPGGFSGVVGDTGQRGLGGARPGQAVDSATARRLGLPGAPSRSFAEDDSVMKALLARPGYRATRFSADSATLFVDEQRIRLEGKPLTRRESATLEADSVITYRRDDCVLEASGTPKLFDKSQVLVGSGIRYDTCRRRGVILGALTNFQEGGTVWFLRGNVANDSSTSRIYAGAGELTSCNLPVPHYHFSAKEVKWVSRTVLAARPVVLYIRDVPVLWLPFIFQDMRPGRHSGILAPQLGFSDIVRPSRDYQRQITNMGYYWAPNDYFDVTFRADWYAKRFFQYGASMQYRILDRFLGGTLAYSRQAQSGGGSSNSFSWSHRQQFNVSTSLNFSLNYVSNSTVLVQNAINPLLNTQQITSSLNFSKQFRWGQFALGGSRRQSLSDSSLTQQFPSLTITPRPLDFGRDVTWSPGLSLTNDVTKRTPQAAIVVFRANGGADTIPQVGDTRVTALNLDTPLRLGTFNWRNSVSVTDQTASGRHVVTFRVPDPSTPDPNDSTTVSQVFNGDFSTGINWDTGINLPVLFRGTWKIQPTLGITNATSLGPFALRNRSTLGTFVTQGKRFQLGLTSSPTLFAFLPGVFGLTRIRHAISPLITFNYSPAASISEAYARAVAQPGQPIVLRSDPTQTLSVGLSQVFEGKGKPQKGDTLGTSARKLRILSINTSPISYDFEQAKLPGRTGWATQTVTNSVLSDLLPGFNLTVTHDLWRGTVGVDTAKFDPFLQSVNASFSLSPRTINSILGVVGLASRSPQTPSGGIPPVGPAPVYGNDPLRFSQPGSFTSTSQLAANRGQGFSATVNYSLNRQRPNPSLPPTFRTTQQSVNFSTAFSPTTFWSLAWAAQYNLTDGRFESQTVRLERDLHEWRATFGFVRNANGNVAFSFSVYLTDLPELKFDFNRTTLEQ
jgi:Tat protein translocase TatC